MNELQLTVHRAAEEIGGNCIELAVGDQRLLLDVGRPLDAPESTQGLLPLTLDTSRPVCGVLVSHAHADHHGLLDQLPVSWPVYAGSGTAELIRMNADFFSKPVPRFHCWKSGATFKVGPFRVTPWLTDHSAFDAHMLSIEAAGKRLLYTGDFRAHGRKGRLVQRLMRRPPADVDVLLMEGTNVGTNKPVMSEQALEDDFVRCFEATAGRAFVSWSAQNVDRTVTLYRACLRSKRTLVIDLYSANALDLIAPGTRLPRPGWEGLKVVITKRLADRYRRLGRGDFVDRMARHGISARALAGAGNWTVLIRPSLIHDFERNHVRPSLADIWCYSQWRGYLESPDSRPLKRWFETAGTPLRYVHTSGHASVGDLQAFAKAIAPKALVPIHGEGWAGAEGFEVLTPLRNGEPWVVV